MNVSKIKNVWVVMLYIWHFVLGTAIVVLPKDITDEEITLAIELITLIALLLMLAIIITLIIIF